MPNRFKLLKFLIAFLMTISLNGVASAAEFMQFARSFLAQAGATNEQNQDYIAQSNQFTTEGEFTAAELAELFLIRAIIFSRLKDADNALDSYSAALSSGNLPPLLVAETYKNRGLLYYGNKTYFEAKQDFENALNILSGNAELHYYLANSYFGLFDFDRALEQYDLALEGMAASRYLAHFGKASVYFQQKEYEKSRINISKSLDVRANFAPASELLAQINNINSNSMQEQPEVATNSADLANAINGEGNTQLTANEIYNQLLEKAFAANQENGKTADLSIPLDIDGGVSSAVETPTKPMRISAIPKSKPPKTVLAEPELRISKQVSDNPFLIQENKQSNRLDNLLTASIPQKTTGYFLQLSSSNSKNAALNYYARMAKKHQLLLNNRPYLIREFKNKKHQSNYQLLISGFDSYKQANSLCKFIKAQQSDCFVRHIK